VNAPDPVYPTLGELKDILTRDFKCWIEPPPKNLAYSRKPCTIIKRRDGDGNELTTPPYFLADNERVDREFALNICRHLHIYPARLNFISNPPVP